MPCFLTQGSQNNNSAPTLSCDKRVEMYKNSYIEYIPVADPGEGPEGRPTPLVLD